MDKEKFIKWLDNKIFTISNDIDNLDFNNTEEAYLCGAIRTLIEVKSLVEKDEIK